MADHKSTGAPSTAPTYVSSPPTSSSGIQLNMGYFKTTPGIIKLIQLTFGILCMACSAPAWSNGTHWFLFVVVTAFVTTTLWSFMYLLNLRQAITLPINWNLTELLNTGITTVLYLIATIVQFCSIYRDYTRNVFGGIFGVLNFVAYLGGCFFLYRDYKEDNPVSAVAFPGAKA